MNHVRYSWYVRVLDVKIMTGGNERLFQVSWSYVMIICKPKAIRVIHQEMLAANFQPPGEM